MMKYMVLLALVACTFACDKYPNGTDSAMHWYMCGSGNQVTADDIKVTDPSGNPDYPFDVRKGIQLHISQNNHGSQIDQVYVDVSLGSWSDGGFMGCKWVDIPTFGLTNNLDACKLGGSAACPIKSGPTTNIVAIDLSQFGPVINLLSAGKPYQLGITMKNGNKSPVGCVVVQGTITK